MGGSLLGQSTAQLAGRAISVRLDPLVGEYLSKTSIPIKDSATRMILLTQLIAQLESSDPTNMSQLLAAGVAPDLLERLRNLSVGDIVRFAAGSYGLSIALDCQALGHDLARAERARQDRSLYESFVRAGASPRLVARLFGVADIEVRRLRRLIAPAMALGGRPRLPEESLRLDIRQAWLRLQDLQLPEKDRYWQLSRQFADLPIATLENVIEQLPRPA